MGGWRRNTRDAHIQDHQRTRVNRKPPAGNWQRSVPSWEKRFCTSVGSVPWGKVLEAKRFMHLYNNVVQWNDSAGEEAFSNAKKRFYAEINGLPCDISLPDPDKYIDEVDWDSAVDSKLISDLEQGQPEGVEEEGSVILGSMLVDQSFGCIGWGDTDEAFQKDSNNLCPAPQFGNSDLNAVEMNSWEQYYQQSNFPSKANNWNNNNWNYNNWNHNHRNDCNWDDWKWSNNQHPSVNACGWGGTWDWNSHHGREGGGLYRSRYKISRYHGNGNQMNHRWRNGPRINRDNSQYQQPPWIGSH
ncbi:hypothetical protein SAY87_017691 [Trapa incisa]|uniref:Uncharacterized protein n=1 Tax=Trapa incisa TaxID=236973 RepID=A0AAN7L478_9MYRT|nr:hypothetical protein SAY87_017691 [Trapa incisa]